ncbi:MAG: hypothetical protein WCD18_09015 [Thermosynechococcaceae cyanobacterium]
MSSKITSPAVELSGDITQTSQSQPTDYSKVLNNRSKYEELTRKPSTFSGHLSIGPSPVFLESVPNTYVSQCFQCYQCYQCYQCVSPEPIKAQEFTAKESNSSDVKLGKLIPF